MKLVEDPKYWCIPTLPIEEFIFGENLKQDLDLKSIHYLLYAMDWNNDI